METESSPAEKTPLQKFFDAQLRDTVDQKPAAVRKQVEKAFAAPPTDADDVDPWFLRHFHKAPVSHDTELFNFLHSAKAGIRDTFSPA